MPKRNDLTNRKFDRLKAIKYIGNSRTGKAIWECECDCGNIVNVVAHRLLDGETKSCGCLRKESTGKRMKGKTAKRTHGDSKTRLYHIWGQIKQRTENKNANTYHNYGGKGIDICKEWSESYEAFKKWALNNGYKDNLTIDRIKNEKGYYPDNCRWVSVKKQSNNRTSNITIDYKGKKYTMKELSEMLEINYNTLRYRINAGWDIEKALKT